MKTFNFINTPIDHRHNFVLFVDCETANDLEFPLAYDLGGKVVDTKGRVYEEFSFVNADIYLRESGLMQSAYYANKLPQYEQGLQNGSRTMSTTIGMKNYIARLCKAYGIKVACAHNSRFDKMALDNTLRYVTKSKMRYFLPYGIEWWDTLRMAESVMLKMPTYERFCSENNYISNSGRFSLTAENLYRFISKDNNFVENHTGLEDVEIEIQIMLYCFRQHKKMRKTLYKDSRPCIENTNFQISLLHNLKVFPTI